MKNLYSNLSRREKDVRDERIVAEYLDNNFYNLWTSGTTRIKSDTSLQYRGVDITCDVDGFEYVIDEKAATHYVGKNLQSFSQELSFVNRAGRLQKGWFMNDENLNDCYVYVWLDEALTTEDNHLLSANMIKRLTASLVQKRDIIKYLKEKGWTKEKLWEKQEQIREAYNRYGDSYIHYVNLGRIKENGLTFYYSPRFSEAPVNILLPRDILVNRISSFSVSYDYDNSNIIVDRV